MKPRIPRLPRPALPPAWLAGWQTAGEQASQHWKQLTARERHLLSGLAAIVIAAALFAIALRPAWREVARWQDDLPALRIQAAAVDALVQEAQALKREQGNRISDAAMLDALRTSLARAALGGTLQVGRLEDDKGWRVTVDGVSPAALFDWLAYAPALLHLHIVQVRMVRPRDSLGRPIPARVSSTLQLRDADDAANGSRS
jgi:general secretion pathway protein M